MSGIMRTFYKDLFEFFHGSRTIVLILVLPVILMILIGGLRIRTQQVDLLVLHPPELEKEALEKLRDLLREFSNLRFVFRDEEKVEPLMIIEKEHFDLVMVLEESRRVFYTAETDLDRLRRLSEIAGNIGLVADEGKPLILLKEPFRSFELVSYFPPLTQRDMFAVPRVIALLVCFIPFLLASGTIIRERNEQTLGLLLVSLGARWNRLYWGKLLLPLFVGLFNLAAMILFAKTWFGLNLKSGFWDILSIHTVVILSSLFLGLIISCLATSQLQALLASAVYLLCLILFTGFVFPTELSSPVIRFLSHFFPLTFSLEPMQSWMFKGTRLYYYVNEMLFLLGQGLFYFLISVVVFWELRKKI